MAFSLDPAEGGGAPPGVFAYDLVQTLPFEWETTVKVLDLPLGTQSKFTEHVENVFSRANTLHAISARLSKSYWGRRRACLAVPVLRRW